MNIKSILASVGRYVKLVFLTIIGSDAAKPLEESITTFISTDVGHLAYDAVEYVASMLPNSDSVAKRDAAKAKLLADAKAVGKDLEPLGEAALNLFVELAYAALKAKLTA